MCIYPSSYVLYKLQKTHKCDIMIENMCFLREKSDFFLGGLQKLINGMAE